MRPAARALVSAWGGPLSDGRQLLRRERTPSGCTLRRELSPPTARAPLAPLSQALCWRKYAPERAPNERNLNEYRRHAHPRNRELHKRTLQTQPHRTPAQAIGGVQEARVRTPRATDDEDDDDERASDAASTCVSALGTAYGVGDSRRNRSAATRAPSGAAEASLAHAARPRRGRRRPRHVPGAAHRRSCRTRSMGEGRSWRLRRVARAAAAAAIFLEPIVPQQRRARLRDRSESQGDLADQEAVCVCPRTTLLA